MNERIRELADQALKECDVLNALNRFAELIVKECAESLWTEECYNSDLALEEFERNSAKIKQHFGVEL
jgi:hypothetical protein